MALDIVAAVVPTVLEYTIGPIKTHICYALYCKGNLQNLKEEVDKLKNEREKLQHLVDAERRNGKLIEPEVDRWMLEVDRIIESRERELGQDEDRAKKKCFAGLCPNFKSRYQLGRKAKKELATVTTALDEQAKFVSIAYRAAPPTTGVIFTKRYQAMESRLPIFKGVMNALKAADVNMVGVCGMGGIGKTTLVKEVAIEAVENKLFDKMVFARVTRTPNIMKIQGEIADQLGLKFDEQSEWGRANRLRERLNQEKKILIVLDDLWKKLDLEAVGVSLKDEQNGCKMLLTSRGSDVLSRDMDVQEKFSINVLNEEEAWDLFKKTAGASVEHPQVEPIAVKIATKCAGLPVAIVTIAKALKDKSLPQWKDALQELERPSPGNFTGVQEKVYSSIEVSYKHLESEELKSTFLLCNRMGYNASTEHLLKYGMGAGLFSDVATIEEARNRVHLLVHKLKTSSLLLDDDSAKQFSIHNVVRDVAISIAYRDCNVFVKSDAVELKWRDKDSLKKCTEIWLHCNSIELPEDLKYQLLKVFVVDSGDPSLEISHKIFGGMQKLKVLGLSNVCFSSLHSSLHLLKNLRSLCLHQSSLGDQIAVIGELKKLEILSLVKSDIKLLPREIGQLAKLKLLDLSDCSELEVIAPNVISSLSLLEELCMGNSFHHWDIEGKSNASLLELAPLSKLTNLDIHVPDSRVMSEDLFSRSLERYRIFIGDVWDWDGAYETSRTLKLKLDERASHLEQGILKLLKQTEDLHILELKGVKNVICELDREGFPLLKHLHLHNSPGIQYIIGTMDGVPSNIFLFPMLESLFLYNLASLEKIDHGTRRTQSFGKLQSLEVENCNKLRNLFSFSMARGLSQLQSIKITSCPNMEEVVEEESEEFDSRNEGDAMEFTQLRFISLQYLPHLKKFFSGEKKSFVSQTQSKSLTADTELGEITLNDELQTPMQLFNNKIVFPKLEELDLRRINADSLWNGQFPAVSIQNLQRLVVADCGNLKYIFSSSMVKSLLQLKQLEVSDCQSVEEIVVPEALTEEETMSQILFPKLEQIRLWDLPKLTQFCTGSLIECPLLKRLNIGRCKELQTFISGYRGTNFSISNEVGEQNLEEKCSNATQPLFDEKIGPPNLEALKLSTLQVEKIWSDQSVDRSSGFYKLTNLTVEGFGRLKYLFTSSMVKSLGHLKRLEICNCKLMEEIIVTEGEIASDVVFPKLDFLKLSGLRNLIRFSTSNSIECPFLKKLQIENCHALETFISNFVTANRKFTLFDETVLFLDLEELRIFGMDNLKMIWPNELLPDSFGKLKVLKVGQGKKLLKVFTPNILQRFQNLENLVINDCDELEEVFDLQPLMIEKGTHSTTTTQLRTMNVKNLPNLKNVWNGNPQEIISFQNLQSVIVSECPSLQNLFPASVALDLLQLEELSISYCGVLEEIVAKEEGVEADLNFVFPKVASFQLWELPELKRFYPGRHTLEVSMLKKLDVYHCDKMPVFDSELQILQGPPCSKKQLEIQVNQPLLSFIKIIPNLLELSLNSKQVIMIMQGHFPADILQKLEVLKLQCFHEESAVFPFDLLIQRFHHIEELVVRDSQFKELLSCGLASEEKHARALARIKGLKLVFLRNLERIWNQDLLVDQLIQNLEKLEVWNCDGLSNLAPSTASFQNLSYLEVWNCEGLIYLIASSTARSLVQLTAMTVRECNVVTEIVANEGDESENEIIFRKLESLRLDCLASLTSFCSANFTFKFPSLTEVIVIQCPKMETFSQGVLSTPKLQRVWLTREKDNGQWKGDLNKTIQQLYTNTQDSAEE